MHRNVKMLLSAALLLLLASGHAMGRGGGGFHGSSGGFSGGFHGEPAGGFHGEGFSGGFRESAGEDRGAEFRGEEMDRGDIDHRLPESDESRSGFDHFRPTPNSFEHGNPGQHAGPGPHPSPTPGPHPGPGPHPDWYHGHWSNHDHPWHNWPAGWWSAGFLAGAAFDTALAPWSWGYWPYDNPYCGQAMIVDGTTIDYSQPIVLATAGAQPQASILDDAAPTAYPMTPADQSMQLLDSARNAFVKGDYAGALSLCERAIAKQPSATVPHEFRGLALFALRRYKEAAGAIYAVLSVGPGWDWETLRSLYPNVDIYTAQLRSLEQYVGAHPEEADARFLLAYHYMTCGYADVAANQLKKVVQLNSQDRLSAQLVAALTTKEGPAPAAAPSAPAKPVEGTALLGIWKASRADGAVVLSLSLDGNYTWTFTQKGKSQEFSGRFVLADNVLILKKGDAPVMVGEVSLLANDRFVFKLPGDNPSDLGLTFSR